jgi:PAS domain S-box-containing protein
MISLSISDQNTPVIAGYTLVAELSRSDRTLVYRAVQNINQRPVIIKILRSSHPSPNELVQFYNQYIIVQNLTIPGIVKALSLEPWQNSYAFIMEDSFSISLREYTEKKSLVLGEILAIAIQLAKVLQDLYQNQIIHKDIKPANILIQPETQQIRLIDFGIASLLPKETLDTRTTHRLEGTLAYLAPEQTGRMNRGIDYRTDFYALGVTLFELLTRQLPFASNDPMEVIYCHLAKQPPTVNSLCPDLPSVLSKIVSKLIAKNAEDRYQSAIGLMHDLEFCLNQWQANGKIDDFEIAIHDLSDRFSISEKLYGRETEVQMLLQAFDRAANGKSELILVAGFSGIGKTALMNEIHKPIVRQRGYFIKGKFDQFNRNIPLAAFIQAFRQLMGQLLASSDAQLSIWKSQILDALGDSAQIIIEVIPELERIIGTQPPAPELSASAAQNRFNLLFQKFIQIFATSTHPLVIFLDDLQWADLASLKLIQLLLDQSFIGCLLIIGTYRDNEVSAIHPLMITLDKLSAVGIAVNTIQLKPLDLDSINSLIADTLLCPKDLAKPITELVYRYTKGNPFFVTQLLKVLHQDSVISLDYELGFWRCDITQIRADLVTDDVLKLMTQKLYKLPESTQSLLKLAACIGHQFDLQTLAIVSEQNNDTVASDLFSALQEGLILPLSETYQIFQNEVDIKNRDYDFLVSYKFLHDRVQQAAYSLISEDHKHAIHLKIGQLLLRDASASEYEERLFEIVNHFNFGTHLIVLSHERENLAVLNLAAGRKAKVATAYAAAINFFATGIDLLPETAWDTHYPLMLALHEEITEASYLNTDFEQMEYWGNLVLQKATSLLDTIQVQQTRITGAKAQGQLLDAIEIGLKVLLSLEIKFPAQPTQEEIEKAIGVIRSLWNNVAPLGLLDLPHMSDPKLLAAMEILTTLISAAYSAAPNLMPLLIFKQVELSIQYGNCPISIFAYGDYGLILCGIVDDIENGYEFGELALSLLEKFQLPAFKSRSWCVVHQFIKHWKKPLSELLPNLQEAYLSGRESGDMESACLSAAFFCYNAYYVGNKLTKLVQIMDDYRKIIDQARQSAPLYFQEIFQQNILNLIGQNKIPYVLSGEIFNAEISLLKLQKSNQRASLFYYYFSQTVLYYIFGKNIESIQFSVKTAEYLDGVLATFCIPVYFFFDALIQLEQYESASSLQKQIILENVQQHQAKLQHWAALVPANHQHRCELVAAEQYRVLGDKTNAIEAYDWAITHAQNNGFIQDEALANELAAKFYLEWDKPKAAAGYMQEAYHCYAQWGAKAKTDDLEQHYSHLLHSTVPSFQNQPVSIESLMNQAHTTHFSLNRDAKTINSKDSTFDRNLDFSAIIKASQSLSSSINLTDLLHQLTQIILQHSGGDRCALILNRDGEWRLEALATPHTTTVSSESLAGNQQIPVKLIQYVKNTQTVAVIDNLNTDLPVIDAYLNQQQPKSILCLPILNQGDLTGVLYLQNQVASGVFTSDRIQVLNLLCTQSAISLKNAQLYQTLEQSENKFRDFVENVNDIIYAITPQGNFSYLSPQFKNLLGYEVDEFLNRSFGFATHPEDMPSVLASMQKLFETGENQSDIEFRVQHQNGIWLWMTCNNTPILGKDESIIGFRGVARDISDRKQAELELQKTNAELIRVSRLKDEFLATMSHELRTPLNTILGMAEGLRDEIFGSVTDRQIKALEMIKNSGSHLLELINDILDVAKIEAGQLELNYTSISVASLCNASLAFIQQQAQTKCITLETKFSSHLPNLWGDELRIRQVLINLLNNAVKFTPQGGSISLQITPSQHPSQVMINGLSQNYLQIAIRDTGIGIAPEHINKLFQPFSQIDGRLNRHYEGTGLGLALVKRIVELHGGQVSLTSQLGIGSCFMIDLPCDDTACPLPLDPQPTPWLESIHCMDPWPLKTPLLLLVENNEANIETLSSYLRAKGYDIVVAKDGLEAINCATLYSPDLILMDIQLPKMNGMEAIQKIRLDPNLAHIPIVALTALTTPSDQERYLALGANDYLSKPVKLKQLVIAIQKLLDSTKLSAIRMRED